MCTPAEGKGSDRGKRTGPSCPGNPLAVPRRPHIALRRLARGSQELTDVSIILQVPGEHHRPNSWPQYTG